MFATISFFALGFVLAGLLPSERTATVVGQVFYFPMLFLSGAVVPRELFPETLHRVSDFLPLTHVVNLIQELWIEGSWNLTALVVLFGLLVVSVAVSARTFRWAVGSVGALTVRELRKEDLSAVRDLGRRAFPLFHALLMSATMSKEGLVAENAPGTIVGSLTLSIRRGKVYGFLVLIQPPSGQATVLSERSGAPLSFSRIGA